MSPSSYQEYKFGNFQGGYYSVQDLDPEMLPANFISAGQRIQFNKQFFSKSDGKQLYLPQPVVSPTSNINGITSFQQSNGNSFLVLSTTTDLFSLAAGGSSWTRITPTPSNLNGSLGFLPKFAAFDDVLYYTDGVDNIVQWNGSGSAQYITTPTGAPTTCADLVPFASYLFAIRPTINGVVQNWTVMWSDNITGQGPNSWNTGQAGSVELIDSQEQIYGGEVFGRWMPLYKRRTIYLTSFVGAPIFFDFQRVDTPGTIARRTIVRLPLLGIFALGEDDVYIFNATQSRPIGKELRQEIFTNLNYAALDTAYAWVRPDLGRVYLNLPYTGQNTPGVEYAYSYVDGQWIPEGNYPSVAGVWATFANPLEVDQLPLPVDTYTMTIAQLSGLNQSQPIITDGTTLLYLSPGTASDFVTPSQVAINSSFSTAKVPVVQRQDRSVVACTVFGIKLTGNNVPGTIGVTLNASIGDGVYQSYGPFAVSMTQAQTTIVPCEVYGERFQVTVANANLNEAFQIKEISLLYRVRGRV